MAYSDFTLDEIKTKFQITIFGDLKLFQEAQFFNVSETLLNILEDNVPLALAIDTEKARSEFIIAPILAEFRKLFKQKLSLFSGIDFNIEPENGLNGVCDFIISYSKEQLYVDTPILILVEAKNNKIKDDIAQCIAEMIAAQIFNNKKKNTIDSIYGIVTTGSLWRFIKLVNKEIFIDMDEYHIKDIKKIFGILVSIEESLTKKITINN